MIEIIESVTLTRRKVIATAPTFAEAKAKVEAMGVAFMEDDEDYHDCADAYTNDGRVISIQPRDLTVRDAGDWLKANGPKAMAMAKERAAALASFDAEFGIK